MRIARVVLDVANFIGEEETANRAKQTGLTVTRAAPYRRRSSVHPRPSFDQSPIDDASKDNRDLMSQSSDYSLGRLQYLSGETLGRAAIRR
jgi:hypothetical protein